MLTSREQGDVGELSALYWLAARGAQVAIPIGNSSHWDLVAEFEGSLLRVQVKTCTCLVRTRWAVTLCTRGGNQSWNGLVKRLDPSRYDYLFVLVGDGRRWFIPSDRVAGASHLRTWRPEICEVRGRAGRSDPGGHRESPHVYNRPS